MNAWVCRCRSFARGDALLVRAQVSLAAGKRAGRGSRALAERVSRLARRIGAVLEVDWAARIDLIHETATERLRFLECDVAPLVGARSAFAASLAAAGVDRSEQLRLLLT